MQDILFIEESPSVRRWCAGTCMAPLGNFVSGFGTSWTNSEEFTGVLEDKELTRILNWAESMDYRVVFIPLNEEAELESQAMQFSDSVVQYLTGLGIGTKGWFDSWETI
tara:strand:- start:516 stop:842 length:327 start_codon:yes stop_codon:yes gene_type:complete